jgi:hypothetical protein
LARARTPRSATAPLRAARPSGKKKRHRSSSDDPDPDGLAAAQSEPAVTRATSVACAGFRASAAPACSPPPSTASVTLSWSPNRGRGSTRAPFGPRAGLRASGPTHTTNESNSARSPAPTGCGPFRVLENDTMNPTARHAQSRGCFRVPR